MISVSRGAVICGILISFSLILFVPGINAQETKTAEQLVKKAYDEQTHGNYNRAIEILTQVIKINPLNAKAYFQRGTNYVVKELQDESIADFNEAIRLNPGYTAAYVYRGMCFFGKNLYDKAIIDYTQVLKLDSKDAFVYWQRAWAYYYKGMPAQALVDIKEARKLDPDKKEYLETQQMILEKENADIDFSTAKPTGWCMDEKGNNYRCSERPEEIHF